MEFGTVNIPQVLVVVVCVVFSPRDDTFFWENWQLHYANIKKPYSLEEVD